MGHNLVLHVIYCKGQWCTTQIWPVIYVKIEWFQFSSHWYPSQSAQQMHKKGTKKRILDRGSLSMCMDFSITSGKRVKSDSPLPWFNLNILISRMDSFLSLHLQALEDPPRYWVRSFKWGQQAASSPSERDSQHSPRCLQGVTYHKKFGTSRFTAAAASRLSSWIRQILSPAGTYCLWLQGRSPWHRPIPMESYGW